MTASPVPRLAAALAWLVLPALVWAAPARVQLELLPEVAVSTSRLRLGDVARVAGDDREQVHAAAAMNLGSGPRVGEVLRLERAQIERWLQRAVGRPGVYEWTGASAVRVERASQWVPADEVCRAAQSALTDWLGTSRGSAQVSPDCGDVAWAVPPGRVELKPHAIAEGQPVARRMQLPVDIWTDGAFARSVPVTMRVRWVGRAWVARRDVRAQQRLDDDVLDLKETELAGLPAAPLAADQPTSGLRLRRPLLAGQVLTAAHVEPELSVSRGQRVRLLSRSGAITLETTAEALQDGHPGQQVLVRVPSASAPVSAWVIGLNQVELKP
jgi:flagella basal body P-ring formation protein FlgA